MPTIDQDPAAGRDIGFQRRLMAIPDQTGRSLCGAGVGVFVGGCWCWGWGVCGGTCGSSVGVGVLVGVGSGAIKEQPKGAC